MKALIFCLIVLTGFISPLALQGKSVFFQTVTKEINHSDARQTMSKDRNDLNPRKKVKKKRKTILNRKTKMRNGHSCPSF